MGEGEQGGQGLVVTSSELRQATVEGLVEEPDAALLDLSPPGARDQRKRSASDKKRGAGKGELRGRPLIKARRATPLPATLQPVPGEGLFEAPAGGSAPVVLDSPRRTRERSRGKSISNESISSRSQFRKGGGEGCGSDAERTSIEFFPAQDGNGTVATEAFLEQEFEFVRV